MKNNLIIRHLLSALCNLSSLRSLSFSFVRQLNQIFGVHVYWLICTYLLGRDKNKPHFNNLFLTLHLSSPYFIPRVTSPHFTSTHFYPTSPHLISLSNLKTHFSSHPTSFHLTTSLHFLLSHFILLFFLL